LARGAIHPAVVVVGHNADEGAMFMPHPVPDRAGYEAWLTRHFGPLAPRLATLHPAADDAAVPGAMSAVLGDAMFVESARLVARASARAGRPTYGYVFTKSVANQPPPPWHSESVRYVFGTLESPGFVPGRPAANAGDHILSRTMRRYWARFAAQGDPNGAGLPAWPRYEAATDAVIEFAEPVHASAGFHRETLDALDGLWDRAR
jgi:para-nitrobenzyl esterase